jgi:hypothetical protein
MLQHDPITHCKRTNLKQLIHGLLFLTGPKTVGEDGQGGTG